MNFDSIMFYRADPQFDAGRVARPATPWFDAQNFSNECALLHAYCCPTGNESHQNYLPQQRTLTADRYGGYGVGYCGGSARCGIDGDVQIKGVGLTPLIGGRPGAPIDPVHSSGTVTMMEAAREAIWSSICEAALPHGAVPTLAIVLTGTQCRRTDWDPAVEILVRRALLMRAVALRPAHFLRNLHFPSARVPELGVCEDYVRVQKMIRTLPTVLDATFGGAITGATATARVNEGLVLTARRYADQVAAAFAKRIYHGSLNCSNIALDGRFLDFGTMTEVKGYRRLAAFPLWPDQWTQYTPLLRTLSYLLFTVGKHLECPEIKSLITGKELTEEFMNTLQTRTEIEFLKLTGIPESVVAGYPQVQRSRAYRCFKRIYSSGADTPYYVRADDDASMIGIEPLRSEGDYDLNHILMAAAQHTDDAQARTALDVLIPVSELATELHAVHTDLRNWFLSQHPQLDATVAKQFLAHQATRLNADLSFLNREGMNTDMEVFEVEPDGLGAYIDTQIAFGKEILCDEPPALMTASGEGIFGLNTQLDALAHMSQEEASAVFTASPLRFAKPRTVTTPEAACATA